MSDKYEKNKSIVIGSVVDTDVTKGLTVRLEDDRIGVVENDQISDVDIGDVKTYFNFFPSYKFRILPSKDGDDKDIVKLSYKLCHPKLVKNKKKIIPTCNHFNTLKKMIWFEIYLYNKKNNIEEITTKKLELELEDLTKIPNDKD